jgi:hypothetical protein
MVYNLGMGVTSQTRRVGRTAVSSVAGRGDFLDLVSLGKDDDIFPVVSVAARKRAPDNLVFLKVVLVPKGLSAQLVTN